MIPHGVEIFAGLEPIDLRFDPLLNAAKLGDDVPFQLRNPGLGDVVPSDLQLVFVELLLVERHQGLKRPE